MSDYSVTSYNPNNINDTLYAYQGNGVVATNPIPQVTKTNYASGVSLDTPPDTFEGVNGVKTINGKKNKENGMSTGLKWLLSIGGTALIIGTGIITHKNFDLKNVSNNFSKIFRRDVSKQETKEIIGKYKEIFQIDDCDEFCKKMFEQVKNDYGYKDCDISLQVRKIVEEKYKDEAGGGWLSQKAKMMLRPYLSNGKTLTTKEKDDIFSTLMHEFQHVKQTEISYRTSPQKLLNALKKNGEIPKGEKLQKELADMKDRLKNDKNLIGWAQERGQSVEALRNDIKKALNGDYSAFEFNENEVKKSLDKVFGKFSKFEQGSDEYKKGLKYIENEMNYINAFDDKEGYLNQILEAEAYGVERNLLPAIKKYININKI